MPRTPGPGMPPITGKHWHLQRDTAVTVTVTAYYDSTRDPFGTMRWDVVACTPFSASDSGTHLEISCAQPI